MAHVLLFHHALGLTPGVATFAQSLRDAGHTVDTPDLYQGRTFDALADGVAHAGEVGLGTIMQRGLDAAAALPQRLVYAGFSLGVLPAQRLAQTRPGALAALLFHACVSRSEFDTGWPAGVPVQVHAMENDPWFVDEGDLDAARALVADTGGAQLFLYPGSGHLFTDAALPDYDEPATRRLTTRAVALLDGVDRGTRH